MAISAQHTKFVTNEYVNALPSEDFIKVALKKQEMYDEGRKQIKQNLDNYGKLRGTIINENERNYFDQELNKMVKNVQQNAGLDFSNMNNVEAVINLGKPFENDEYIKTALENGAEYQRRQKELASIAKDKRNADNDLVYMYDVQNHISSGGLGQKLAKNKTYNEYVDIKEKVSKIEKDVQGKMQTVYREGPTGYIEQIEIERKTKEEIAARIKESLTPAEQAQLQVHAQAQMYRLGNDVLYQTWVGANKQEKLMFEDAKKKALYERSELQAIKTKTTEQVSRLNELDQIIQTSDAYITAATENANMNPDNFDMEEYLPFFTNRFISGIAGNLVVEKVKTELKEDKAYIMNVEHRNRLSEISAQGQQTRLNEQFKFQQENYAPSMKASLYSLRNVTNVLGSSFKLDGSKTGSEQIDQIIAELDNDKNPNAKKLSTAMKGNYKQALNSLKNVYSLYEGGENVNDLIIFGRSQGLGQIQTSVKDFLSMSVIDVFNSGLELDAMSYRPKKSSTSSSDPDAKIDKELEEAKTRLLRQGKTQAFADSTVNANFARDPNFYKN